MYRFSITPDRDGKTFGISNLELNDAILGAALSEMDCNQVEDLRNRLIDGMFRVVLYTAEIPVSDYDRWVRFFKNAHLIHAENVLLSQSCIDGASDEEILRVIAVARAFSIRALFRVEAAHIGEFDLDRYARLRSEDTGLFFDPGEYVRLGKNPNHDILYKCRVKDDVTFLHVKDLTFETFLPMVPGHGNSQLKECASNLICRSYRGYISFTPYGPEVPDVIEGFKAILKNM